MFLQYKPPAPTWFGFPPNLVEKWLAFACSCQINSINRRPDELRAQITGLDNSIGTATRDLAEYRSRLEGEQQAVALAKQQLEPVDPAVFAAEYDRLVAIPEVIGTRVDFHGQLIIMVRVAKDGHDLGDYELSVNEEDDYNPLPIQASVNRVRTPGRRHPALYFLYGDNVERYRTWPKNDFAELFLQVNLCGFVQFCLERIQDIPDRYLNSYPDLTEIPEPIWDGFTANPHKAFGRLLKHNYHKTLQTRLEELQDKVTRLQRQIDHCIHSIREKQHTLRGLRADLAMAEKIVAASIVLDEERAKRQLRVITKLPGVMGMRFNDTGAPILHIRTSYVWGAKRYDMGDVEITLNPTTHSANVLTMAMTRFANKRLLYWTRRETGEDGVELGSFCFGDRVSEINDLLRRGEFDHGVHLIINSLNSINQGEHSATHPEDRYKQIPLDCEWRACVRTRPRRRKRNQGNC